MVHIVLERSVAVRKLLGRAHCKACDRSFNTCDILENGYEMPAILPDPHKCPLGFQVCSEVRTMQHRSDDTEAVIKDRFDTYETNIRPILSFYHQNNSLLTFEVKRGIKDLNELVSAINHWHNK